MYSFKSFKHIGDYVVDAIHKEPISIKSLIRFHFTPGQWWHNSNLVFAF